MENTRKTAVDRKIAMFLLVFFVMILFLLRNETSYLSIRQISPRSFPRLFMNQYQDIVIEIYVFEGCVTYFSCTGNNPNAQEIVCVFYATSSRNLLLRKSNVAEC